MPYPYMIGPDDDGAYRIAFNKSLKIFQRLTPPLIAHNTGCPFDARTQLFTITSFGQTFDVSWPDGTVCFSQTTLKPEIGWRLIVLNYFSAATVLPLSGKWVSYKDQPQGAIFYPNIRTHVIEPMGLFYDTCDKKNLKRALPQVGFSRIDGKADLTADAFFAPRIPVRIQFWAGDDEFPGSFQILFDQTISEQMHIEDSALLCDLVAFLLRTQSSNHF
ncbi:MAG: DUF3786 domain-containing protein [Eubacterium sp.]